jgi:hypothetical protein
MIEAEFSKWLTMFLTFLHVHFVLFYLWIAPLSQTFMEFYLSQTFLDFCLNAASSLACYMAYNLHPSCIVMPILLLLYALLLYYCKPSNTQLQPVPILGGQYYAVDCTFGLPSTYMVFSCIMYLPNYIQLLRNCHQVCPMNASLLENSVLDAL